jgi:hypothetical protein
MGSGNRGDRISVHKERALVLVKALPHAGQKHGETVCCAGVTSDGEWRRQFPIHFRRLKEKFARWDWVEYDFVVPRDDQRPESRSVQEDTLHVVGRMPERDRANFLRKVVVPSTGEAAARGQTLALIRPRDVRFYWSKKTTKEIETERGAYADAAKQRSFFDDDLAALEPCPYAFKFDYRTDDGATHQATCDDWETSAMFYRQAMKYGADGALSRMDRTFNVDYVARGMAFALGTHSKYPSTWLLVGVLRLDKSDQMALAI